VQGAIYPKTDQLVNGMPASISPDARKTAQGRRAVSLTLICFEGGGVAASMAGDASNTRP
jgi:hypothetical protein